MICRSCYREVPPQSAWCPFCGARLGAARAGEGETAPETGAAPAAPAAGPGAWANPWEERAGRGAVAAFAETLQESLFRPAAFFRGTAPDRGAGAALLYAVVVGTLSLVVAMLWQRALGDRVAMQLGSRHLDLLDHRSALAGLTLLLPVGIALLNLVHAAILHVALAVLGGARGTYGTTLKAVCYSWSAMAFNVFPLCGGAVGAVWQAVVQVIGLRELHRTSTARAFWAWFLPFAVAFCLAGLVVAAAMVGLARLWQELGVGKYEL